MDLRTPEQKSEDELQAQIKAVKASNMGVTIGVKELSRGSGASAAVIEMEEELLECKRELERRETHVRGMQRNYDSLAYTLVKQRGEMTQLTDSLTDAKLRLDEYATEAGEYRKAQDKAKRLQDENAQLIQQITDKDTSYDSLEQECHNLRVQAADLTEFKSDLMTVNTDKIFVIFIKIIFQACFPG